MSIVKDKALAPVLGLVKPMARKYATAENMSALFDALTARYPAAEGEKSVLLVSRTDDGTVMGGVWSVDTASRTLTGCYAQQPLDELVAQLLERM